MTKNWKNYSDARFEALQSLSKGEFELLLKEFQPIVEKYFRYHTLQGEPRVLPAKSEAKNSSLMGSDEKLFFILYFLKNNPLQESIGAFFEMSQGKVSQWVKLLLPLLTESLSKLRFVPTQRSEELYRLLESKGEEYIVLQDATVREIERSTDWQVQKEFYDGRHEMGNISRIP
ncbi:MAG: transposase family protein [Bacteroidota bacterium]